MLLFLDFPRRFAIFQKRSIDFTSKTGRMIYASILTPDGHHADFSPGSNEPRVDVTVEDGVLVLHARDGSASLRVKISGELLDRLAGMLGRVDG